MGIGQWVAGHVVKYVGKKVLADMVRSKSAGTGNWDFFFNLLDDKFRSAGQVFKAYGTGSLELQFRTMLLVYSCCRKIYTVSWEAPLQLGNVNAKGEFSPVREHPLLDLFRNPNPKMSWQVFKAIKLLHLLTTGVSYTLKRRNKAGQVAEVYPIPTSWVSAKVNDNGDVVQYKVRQGSGQDGLTVSPLNMAYDWFPDAQEPMKGISPLHAALRDVQTDEERSNYIMEMLVNMKMPGIVFTQKGTWTAEQRKAVEEAWEDKTGKGMRGSPVFVGGEGKVDMMAPLKDLDWPGLSDLSETRICSAYGVPPIVIGLRSGLENGTYSNYEQAIQAFYKGTMVPTWMMLDSMFTENFIDQEPLYENSGLQFRHNLSMVKALQENLKEMAEVATLLFQGGLIDRDRARELVNEPPLKIKEHGKATLIPMGYTAVRLDQKPEEIDPLLDEPDPNTGDEPPKDPPEGDPEEEDEE